MASREWFLARDDQFCVLIPSRFAPSTCGETKMNKLITALLLTALIPAASFSDSQDNAYRSASNLTFCAVGMLEWVEPSLHQSGYVEEAQYAHDIGLGAKTAAAFETAMFATGTATGNETASINHQMQDILGRVRQFYSVQTKMGSNVNDLVAARCAEAQIVQPHIIAYLRKEGVFDPNVSSVEVNYFRRLLNTSLAVWN
jgi:hypothetical protein